MSEPFLGQLMIVGYNFAQRGWAYCDGALLPINQYQALYALLGTTYGGDGRTNFALPDLRGRTPIDVGSSNGGSHALGSKGGAETITLSVQQMPSHDHVLSASTANATTNSPGTGANLVLARANIDIYRAPQSLVALSADSVTFVGGGQAHNDMQPYLTLNIVIALQGIFPSRN